MAEHKPATTLEGKVNELVFDLFVTKKVRELKVFLNSAKSVFAEDDKIDYVLELTEKLFDRYSFKHKEYSTFSFKKVVAENRCSLPEALVRFAFILSPKKGEFFLSAQSVSDAFGYKDREKGSLLLREAIAEGIITLVKRGCSFKRTANTYKLAEKGWNLLKKIGLIVDKVKQVATSIIKSVVGGSKLDKVNGILRQIHGELLAQNAKPHGEWTTPEREAFIMFIDKKREFEEIRDRLLLGAANA